MAVLVDAADYFVAVRDAMLKAREQILLIGWDFDPRIKLDPVHPLPGIPNRVGKFMTWLVRTRPELRIHVLTWRLSLVTALFRGLHPGVLLKWGSGERLQFRLAADHPVGASHHQKIIVIDDAVAFCGGIDMTADRWDTRAHLDEDHRRRRPSGVHYEPFHDVATAVDGAAARALGDLARRRWKGSTGVDLPCPVGRGECWPDALRPDLERVEVGIARTQPGFEVQEEAYEVEALWLAAIRSARRSLYIEAQYFASRIIGKALLERLREPDGPEILVINPTSAHDWLEETAMGAARDHIVAALRAADPERRRFGIYAPVTRRGRRIYVHAKVLIADDRVLRIGSSNINNRSMGLDTECDLAVEAPNISARETILRIRDELLAEHLGVTPTALRDCLARTGSMIAAVEALRRDQDARTLCPMPEGDIGIAAEFMVESELLDPERPRWPFQSLIHRLDWRWVRRKKV